MNRYDDRIKLDVFKSQTTYQNDYKIFPLERTKPISQTKDYKVPEVVQPKEHTYCDNETYISWRKNVHIPFDLLWRPKEIIRTNPYEPFKMPSHPESADKEEVIKTRPRVYMSPAISVDDVSDPETRKLILSYTYTSEWTKAIQESEVRAAKRHIPNSTVEKSGDPVKLRVDLLPPLPEQFRKNGKEWESSQLKYNVDPTKTFWLHKDPPVKCGACNDPVQGLVPQETKDEINKLIKQNRLRIPHDEPIPGYAGYKPMLSYGVPLEKNDLPVVHPLLTVSQAITKRYQDDHEKDK